MKNLILFTFIFICGCGPALNVEKEIFDDSTLEFQSARADTEDLLTIIVFDVGQGDAALVIAPSGEAALIDTGPPEACGKISGLELDYLFISHYDIDHSGSIGELGIEPHDTKAGDVYNLGDVSISVLLNNCEFADGQVFECDPDDNNEHSAAMLIEYGSFRYLTAGDLPGGGGNPPYDTIDLETPLAPLVGDIDILHVGHHGSATSTNQNLLDITTPEIAIISVGVNEYFHPHRSVIDRLINSGIEVYQTGRGWLDDSYLDDINVIGGDIMIESDGYNYTIR